RMDWVAGDVLKVHGTSGMAPIMPRPGEQPPGGGCPGGKCGWAQTPSIPDGTQALPGIPGGPAPTPEVAPPPQQVPAPVNPPPMLPPPGAVTAPQAPGATQFVQVPAETSA